MWLFLAVCWIGVLLAVLTLLFAEGRRSEAEPVRGERVDWSRP
ncbi:hypothetical protein [Halalkalicoccus tibetensis]|uniref:Uncharacterized protein n=1 Tax=Halalkalicoccus tibetensis TaxID=175632 RepID=A0ABD5V434_9EURY